MRDFEDMLRQLEPEETVARLGRVLGKLFPLLSEQAQTEFILHLVGESAHDKVTSLVHL